MGNASQYKFNSWVVVGENSLTTQNIGVFTQPRHIADINDFKQISFLVYLSKMNLIHLVDGFNNIAQDMKIPNNNWENLINN